MSLPADDLLSAFHDGEVNSAERAAVEQLVAMSAEARRELSEIQQVAWLLKELPRDRLPSEFPQQVLQAIEREMLIPSSQNDGLVSLAAPARESWDKPVTTRRWVAVAAVVTSAASLFLLVRAMDERPARETADVRQVAEASKALPAAADFDREASFGGGAASRPMAADAETSASRVSGGAAGLHSTPADSPAGASVLSARVVTRDSNGLFLDQTALRDHKIGDLVRAMQTEGTEVAVVWLTVVDRQEGLAGLQLLLANNQITSTEGDKQLDKSKKLNGSADQMHAIFVESDPDQLAAAVKQLRDKSFLQSLEVDQPIELAQLDEVRSEHDLSYAKRRIAVRSSVAEEKKSDIGRSTQKAAPIVAGKLQDAKDQLAKQVTLELTRESLVQNQLSQQTRTRGAFRNQVRSQTVTKQDADKPPADQRPMQVLFVVVDQVQAGKSAAPNNAPKPAAPAKARTEPAKPAGQDGAA